VDHLRIEILTSREKRAAAVFAIALVLLVGSVTWVVRSGGHLAPGRAATPPVSSLQRFATFTFVSATSAYAIAGVLENTSGHSDPMTHVVAYRTADGARTWQRLPMPSGAHGLPLYLEPLGGRSLLLAVGDPIGANPDSFWLSPDAGSSWRRFPTPAAAGVGYLDALDQRVAYLVTHPYRSPSGGSALSIYWTTDAGASWRQTLQLDAASSTAGALEIDSPYTSPVFTDDRNGWMMSGSFVPRPGGSRPILLRTADGGATWREVAIPAPPDKTFTLDVPVFPDDRAHGYLALGGSAGILIYETRDGGETWAPPYQAGVPWFSAASDRWVYSDGRNLLTSRDWGRTWSSTVARLPKLGLALGHVQPAGAALWSFKSGDGPGYSTGTETVLLRSTDGGATWNLARWPGM
jgi:photosystem II stability/assembly factor-like uncharacterized protein